MSISGLCCYRRIRHTIDQWRHRQRSRTALRFDTPPTAYLEPNQWSNCLTIKFKNNKYTGVHRLDRHDAKVLVWRRVDQQRAFTVIENQSLKRKHFVSFEVLTATDKLVRRRWTIESSSLDACFYCESFQHTTQKKWKTKRFQYLHARLSSERLQFEIMLDILRDFCKKQKHI